MTFFSFKVSTTIVLVVFLKCIKNWRTICPNLSKNVIHKAKRIPRQTSVLPLVSRPRSIIRQLRISGKNVIHVDLQLTIWKMHTSIWSVRRKAWHVDSVQTPALYHVQSFFAYKRFAMGPCALRHGIQHSMEAILACHPALSTKWLDWVGKWCELWRMRTGPIVVDRYDNGIDNVDVKRHKRGER